MTDKTIPYKIYLEENEMPKYWYNVRADMTNKPAPLVNPGTGKPMTAEELGGVFCEELVKQELDNDTRYYPIPQEILDFYKMYRPSPLTRAYHFSGVFAIQGLPECAVFSPGFTVCCAGTPFPSREDDAAGRAAPHGRADFRRPFRHALPQAARRADRSRRSPRGGAERRAAAAPPPRSHGRGRARLRTAPRRPRCRPFRPSAGSRRSR